MSKYSNYVPFSQVHVLTKDEVLAISSLNLNETMCIKLLPGFTHLVNFDHQTVKTIDYNKLFNLSMRTFFMDKKYPTSDNFVRLWTDGPDKCAYFIPEYSENGIGFCVEELEEGRLGLSKVYVLDWDYHKRRGQQKEMEL